MPLWGRNDQAVTANSTTTAESTTGAPIGTYVHVKAGGGPNAHFGNTSSGSRAATDVAMFGNTTVSAFIPGKAVGVMGVDTTEIASGSGNLALGYVLTAGSGYGANAVVTINGSNTTAVNATAGSTGTDAGRITAVKIALPGSGYALNPTVSIAAPGSINITANSTGFSNTNDTLAVATANSRWQVGDRLYYSVPAGNTAIAPLVGNTYYWVSFANTTTIKLANTPGGSNIDITDARTTNPGEVHTITGDTATGYVTVNAPRSVAHAGWVLRTEGTGGRAGRVHYETLVAMGSLGVTSTTSTGVAGAATTADASDDTILPP